MDQLKPLRQIEMVEVPEQAYFKVGRAARYIGLSTNILRELTDLGDIPAKRLPRSGHRLYSKVALDEYYQNLPDWLDPQERKNYPDGGPSTVPIQCEAVRPVL